MSGRIVSVAEADAAPRDLEDWFPGRWDPKRAIDRDLRPAVHAAGLALEQAGWWTPGSGETVNGGLVVGVDTHGVRPGLAFARSLASEAPVLRPSSFIHSLPSTPATTLGLLLGLKDYQTTVATGGLAGVDALDHALDLLALERCARVLVVALSVDPPAKWRLGVALALEPAIEGLRVDSSSPRGEGPEPFSSHLVGDLSVGYGESAAVGLLKVARAWSRGEAAASHQDATWARAATVTLGVVE